MAQGSVVYQIQKTVNQNTVPHMSQEHRKSNKIPKSKNVAKARKIDHKYIFSFAYSKDVMKVINRVAKFGKIKNVKEMNPEITKTYIESKIYSTERTYSKKYIQNEIAAIKKFGWCLRNTGRKSKYDESIAVDVEIPDNQVLTESELGGRYETWEVEKIKDYLEENSSEKVNQVAELQIAFGLRTSEATKIEARNIDIENQKIIILKEQNITKNGKPRKVEKTPALPISKERLKEIVGNKTGKEKVFNLPNRTYQDNIKKAVKGTGVEDTEKGGHGFRGHYAYQKLKEELSKFDYNNLDDRIRRIWRKHGNGITDAEKISLEKVSENLGHERTSVVVKYYIPGQGWEEVEIS